MKLSTFFLALALLAGSHSKAEDGKPWLKYQCTPPTCYKNGTAPWEQPGANDDAPQWYQEFKKLTPSDQAVATKKWADWMVTHPGENPPEGLLGPSLY